MSVDKVELFEQVDQGGLWAGEKKATSFLSGYLTAVS